MVRQVPNELIGGPGSRFPLAANRDNRAMQAATADNGVTAMNFCPLAARLATRAGSARTVGVALVIGLLASALLNGCTHNPGDEQTLVDRATLTAQEMMTQTVSDQPRSLLRQAKAVMICPQVFKAGFMFGGEGGGCVLLARGGNGVWSYPAFYGLGSGSFGLQIGIQDSQVLMLIMTSRGLNAVMDSQIKLGADASIAVATLGAGVQGSTTTAVGADIVAFAGSRGLYGGISLEGRIMSARTDWNQGYYGQPFAARQIVAQMQASNPGADPLRGVLTRFGQPEPMAAPPSPVPVLPAPSATGQPPGYAPAYPPQGQPIQGQQIPGQPVPLQSPPAGYAPAMPPGSQPAGTPPPVGGRPPVQEQSLPPPR